MVAFLTVMGIVLLNLLIAFLTGAHSETRMLAKAKVGGFVHVFVVVDTLESSV